MRIVRAINAGTSCTRIARMATRAEHRAVVAAVLLLLVAAAQPAAAAAVGAGAGSAADGRSSGAAATGGARVPPAVRVQCTRVHVVRTGETCASVARAAGLTVGQFMLLNPTLTCAAMHHGQWVCNRGSAIGG